MGLILLVAPAELTEPPARLSVFLGWSAAVAGLVALVEDGALLLPCRALSSRWLLALATPLEMATLAPECAWVVELICSHQRVVLGGEQLLQVVADRTPGLDGGGVERVFRNEVCRYKTTLTNLGCGTFRL